MSLKSWWKKATYPDLRTGSSLASREFIIKNLMERFPMTKREDRPGHLFEYPHLVRLFGDKEYRIPTYGAMVDFELWIRGRYLARFTGWLESVFECENHEDDGESEANHGEKELGEKENYARGPIDYIKKDGGCHEARWRLAWHKGELRMFIIHDQSGKIQPAEDDVKEVIWFGGA